MKKRLKYNRKDKKLTLYIYMYIYTHTYIIYDTYIKRSDIFLYA